VAGGQGKGSSGNGSKGGKGSKRPPVRGGKGSPWANARSKAAGSRSSSSSRSSSVSSAKNRPQVKQTPRKPQSRSEPAEVSGALDFVASDGVDVDADTQSAPASPLAASVKLQKFLADQGFGSRRELERWIAAGRIEVNDSKATIGDRVFGNERIVVDGKAIGGRGRNENVHPRVLLLNKAEGVICTRRDPEGRKTVFADLPNLRSGRWISVGRLDVATTGLLLLCNDGELAHRMMHPSTGLDREYAVRTDVVLDDDQLAALKAGVESEGEVLRFADIRYFDGRGANHWYHVVLLEGRNHEVRRLFASVGAEVGRLKRVRYGPVVLPSWLRRGQRFELNNRDISSLYATLGMHVSLPPEKPNRRGDRRNLADRSVLIAYPELPSVERSGS